MIRRRFGGVAFAVLLLPLTQAAAGTYCRGQLALELRRLLATTGPGPWAPTGLLAEAEAVIGLLDRSSPEAADLRPLVEATLRDGRLPRWVRVLRKQPLPESAQPVYERGAASQGARSVLDYEAGTQGPPEALDALFGVGFGRLAEARVPEPVAAQAFRKAPWLGEVLRYERLGDLRWGVYLRTGVHLPRKPEVLAVLETLSENPQGDLLLRRLGASWLRAPKGER